MRGLILIGFILFTGYQIQSQTNDAAKRRRDSLIRLINQYEIEINGKYSSTFTVVKGQPGIYENQGRYHSAYFHLQSDSSFVYYRVFEGGYSMTLGKYTTSNGVTRFTWDSLKTMQAVKDKAIYGKYYKYGSPSPRIMENISYRVYADSLVYIPN